MLLLEYAFLDLVSGIYDWAASWKPHPVLGGVLRRNNWEMHDMWEENISRFHWIWTCFWQGQVREDYIMYGKDVDEIHIGPIRKTVEIRKPVREHKMGCHGSTAMICVITLIILICTRTNFGQLIPTKENNKSSTLCWWCHSNDWRAGVTPKV